MTTVFYKRKQKEVFTKVQLFSFGADKVSIDDLIKQFNHLKEKYGCTHFQIRVPFGSSSIGDLSIYGVKERLETKEEYLERLGIPKEDRETLIEALLDNQ